MSRFDLSRPYFFFKKYLWQLGLHLIRMHFDFGATGTTEGIHRLQLEDICAPREDFDLVAEESS